jgi:hypothetical protein
MMPLARDSRGKDKYVPSTQAVLQGVEVATRLETAEYLAVQFQASLTADMVESSQGIISSLEANRRNKEILEANREQEKRNCLRGIEPAETRSDEETLVAGETLKTEMVKENVGELKIDFEISNTSRFRRVFTDNDNPVNEVIEAQADNMLHHFYERNDMEIEITEEGSFIVTKNGRERVDPERARELTTRELPGYLEKHGIHANIKGHYPEGEAPAPVQPAVQKPEINAPEEPQYAPE